MLKTKVSWGRALGILALVLLPSLVLLPWSDVTLQRSEQILVAAKAEQERQAAAKAEQERQAAAKAEQERQAEKAEQERLAATKADQERKAAAKDAAKAAAEERQRAAAAKAAAEEQQRAAAKAAADEQQRAAAAKAAAEEQQRAAAAKAEAAEQQRAAAAKADPAADAEARRKAEAEQQRAKPELREKLLPEFPWPPPRASASYVLPGNLLQNHVSVGEVTGAIISALERNGYVERSFFQTEANGVALVTRLERIKDDGSAFDASERWPSFTSNTYDIGSSALFRFLSGLFVVDPGRYRIIVFILQTLPFSQSLQQITAPEAQAWLFRGANVLPPEVARRPFNGAYCTALIYEFSSDGSQVRVIESRLTGKDHLTKAGVLSFLEKPN